MKKIINTIALIALSGLLASCQQNPTATKSTSTQIVKKEEIDWSKAGVDARKNKISFEQVKEDVKNGAIFLDVRSQEEFQSGNLEITQNLPITDIREGKLPNITKDTKIYVHCLKGIRSAEAVKILRNAGFTQVYDMGGIDQVVAIGGIIK